ncbi:MAG: class I SAM-dependent methyltransferase [Alphaproteobacteria bacterium]|nr:class I SAM-dependent methyltransferase [Alphaproteobacteria bacterium]
MTALSDLISRQITRFGPINIAEYMTLCLLHPTLGYYTTRDPIGAKGDFVTAPEISQMFGEMLGLALAQTWQDQGAPSRFLLTELGPGRGSLMADILRATRNVTGFWDAAEIWLVEASPRFQAIQQQSLAPYRVSFVGDVSDLPAAPLFLVANEFFDALPIRQFIRDQEGWCEQMVGLDAGKLVFGLAAPIPDVTGMSKTLVPIGGIVETCLAAQSIMGEISAAIACNGGAAIVIDYGDWGSHGDTFQAVQNHQKTDPLGAPGHADLTAHVDFLALAAAASGSSASKLVEQGVLLERLGITERARMLATKLQGRALENHIAAHRRLVHPDEMGALFKAIAFHANNTPPPPGFD